jgi:hypothetical protein
MFNLFCPMWDHHSLLAAFPDMELLEKYFEMEYAPIEWK